MATGKGTTTPPEATLRSSGSGLVQVRSGFFSLLAFPGLGFLQLTSGATTGTAGTTTTTSTSTSTSAASTTIRTAIATSTVTTGIAHKDHCRVSFLYPKGDGLEFYHLDTLNVTYQSFFQNPTLHCLCNEPDNNRVIERKSLCVSPFLQKRQETTKSVLLVRLTSHMGLLLFLFPLLSFTGIFSFGDRTRGCIRHRLQSHDHCFAD